MVYIEKLTIICIPAWIVKSPLHSRAHQYCSEGLRDGSGCSEAGKDCLKNS